MGGNHNVAHYFFVSIAFHFLVVRDFIACVITKINLDDELCIIMKIHDDNIRHAKDYE